MRIAGSQMIRWHERGTSTPNTWHRWSQHGKWCSHCNIINITVSIALSLFIQSVPISCTKTPVCWWLIEHQATAPEEWYQSEKNYKVTCRTHQALVWVAQCSSDLKINYRRYLRSLQFEKKLQLHTLLPAQHLKLRENVRKYTQAMHDWYILHHFRSIYSIFWRSFLQSSKIECKSARLDWLDRVEFMQRQLIFINCNHQTIHWN